MIRWVCWYFGSPNLPSWVITYWLSCWFAKLPGYSHAHPSADPPNSLPPLAPFFYRVFHFYFLLFSCTFTEFCAPTSFLHSLFSSRVFLLRDFGAHYLERYLAFSFCNPNRVDIECHFFSLKQRKMTQIDLSVLATVMEQNVKNPVDFVNVPHCTEFFLFSQPRFSFVFLTLGRLG